MTRIQRMQPPLKRLWRCTKGNQRAAASNQAKIVGEPGYDHQDTFSRYGCLIILRRIRVGKALQAAGARGVGERSCNLQWLVSAKIAVLDNKTKRWLVDEESMHSIF